MAVVEMQVGNEQLFFKDQKQNTGICVPSIQCTFVDNALMHNIASLIFICLLTVDASLTLLCMLTVDIIPLCNESSKQMQQLILGMQYICFHK